MDRRYWVVLKVILVRPWTKFVLGFWLFSMVAVCVPLSNLKFFREPMVAIPAFDQPGLSISEMSDLKKFSNATGNQLFDVQTLNSAALPNTSFVIVDGKLAEASGMHHDSGSWPILAQLPSLKSLTIQPQHVINAAGWEKIGQLSELESLWIPNTSAESTQMTNDAHRAATRAMEQLTKLRQINVENANLPPLPPMPNLEYAVLDATRSLDQNLKTLAADSPRLKEIAIRPYDGFQLTNTMCDSIRSMLALRTIWIWTGEESESKVLSPQLAIMRASLPGITVHRGEYSRFRSIGLFVFAVTMFWPYIVSEFHRSMMLAMPLAGYIPGYERPHLFWPLLASALFTVTFLIICHVFDVAWYAALAIGLSGLFFSSPPGLDWNRWLRMIHSWTSTSLLAGTFAILLSLKTAPLFAERFLAGELPILAAMMITAGLILMPFRIAGATGRYRLWSQMETPIIPGLPQGMDQYAKAVPRTGKSRNPLLLLQDFMATRRLQQSRTRSFTLRLMAATSSSASRLLLFLFVVIAVLLVHYFIFSVQNTPTPILGVALFQGAMMSLMITSVGWVGRRSSLALDLLRPVSRVQFWKSIQLAILKEMAPTVVFTVAGVLSLTWIEQQERSIAWVVLIPVVLICATGFLAMFHAMTIWVCIASRLWFAMTVSLVSLLVVVSMATPIVPLIIQEGNGPIIAVVLSVLLLLMGVIAQLAIRRSLPNRELGMIGH